jgi:spore coat polysaccharide biosynthesis protein SpsF
MTTAVIIQARMNSTRLPGKVLFDLAGRTVLSHVLARCAAIGNADVVCCAVSNGRESDPIAEEAESCGVVVTRGSESDVLGRYFHAAETVGADAILRVTSDCPLIDPEVCAGVLDLRQQEDADYACNNTPPSWPHGLDCEAFTMAALKRAYDEATLAEDREHVTPWLRRHEDMKRVNYACPQADWKAQRWTLDYAADYTFFAALFDRLPADTIAWRTAVRTIADDPDLTALQAACRRPLAAPS